MIRGWIISALMVVLGVAGCSGRMNDKWRQMMPPTFQASGFVEYQGKPLTKATVVFHPRGGDSSSARAAAGVTDSAGRFVLTTLKAGDGGAAGPYAVTIHKSILVTRDGRVPKPNEFGDILEPTTEKPLIPEKYFMPDTSGLSAEITPSGRNEFSFTLQ
ncbi:MAG: DUF4198 domain-containing protein [Planctomycetia bacterium]|nr:DUF4198 domain-containing protein [Planctomycetia bacterium]